GGVDGAGLGETGASRAGRDAGASERRGGLVSAPLDLGALPGRSPNPSSSTQGGDRSRPRHQQSASACSPRTRCGGAPTASCTSAEQLAQVEEQKKKKPVAKKQN